MPFPAFHLPGVALDDTTDVDYKTGDVSARLQVPSVTPTLIEEAIATATAARDGYLAGLSTRRVIEVIDAAVTRWLDPDYPLRRLAEELLPAVTGYSTAMLERGIPDQLKAFTADGLTALVEAELGSLEALDRRHGPRLIAHVLAGNIPAVAAESIIRGLLAKSAGLVKASSRDPLFPALFAQSLGEVDPRLAETQAVLPWKGGSDELDVVALHKADAVIAYGGRPAVAAVRRLAPNDPVFVEHGPRIGFAAIGREALTERRLDALAEAATWDVSLFDQQGCVAPHALYVERGGQLAPHRFAQALAGAMERFEQRYPRAHLAPEDAAEIQAQRDLWELRGSADHGPTLFRSEGSTAWTVVFNERDVELRPSCLNRFVHVIPLDDLSTLPAAIEGMRPYLQTAGVEVAEERMPDLEAALEAAGVTRVCGIGEMQYPPASWRHDGRPNLLPLLRQITGFPD